jgi:hypothetical protein
LGWTGGEQWPAFARSPEARDGFPDPLNRWSKQAIDSIAVPLDAAALYRFGGPPWHDFQRWALKAEAVCRSPLGLLIHPRWGLWHSYRGALALHQRFKLAPRESANPCEVCRDQPCLSASPVSAFAPECPYDHAACCRISKPAKRTARPEPASLDLHLVPPSCAARLQVICGRCQVLFASVGPFKMLHNRVKRQLPLLRLQAL